MCLEKNCVKPEGNIFYKVFVEHNGITCWALRNESGNIPNHPEAVKEGKQTSTDHGFCVWEKKEDAELFAELLPKIKALEINKTVVKKVHCEQHIQSGLAMADYQENPNVFDFKKDKKTLRQAFTFKHITVI